MITNRMPFVIATLMLMASVSSVVARPDRADFFSGAQISLEVLIPKNIGDWREEPQRIVQVVNPQAQQALEEEYSQVLIRSYVNADGYRIMLSLAYGSDQQPSWKIHEPEVCYSMLGFTLNRTETSRLVTPYGEIPVRRLFASKGPREEPVTYWIRVGDKAVGAGQSRLTQLMYTLSGRSTDGLLFRISSIDSDQANAYQLQDQFINQLIATVPAGDRKHLSGLGDS